jgi:hypothetical protein
MKERVKIIANEEGQSIFELVVFLPLMLVVLTMMITTGNAINSSINQLKATRGYYYFLLRGNSMGQRNSFLEDAHRGAGIRTVGFNAIGWRRAEDNSQTTLGVCYRYNSFLSAVASSATCDSTSSAGDRSPYIKVFTMYGVCTETYVSLDGGTTYTIPHNFSGTANACVFE